MGIQPKPTPKRSCEACGAQMERKRFGKRLEDFSRFMARKYCDQACMAKAMEKDACASLSQSRMKAARSAKTKCEACGATHDLQVHHQDENPRNNDPSNLRTLCRSCHRRAHSPNFTATGEQRAHCAHCSKPSIKKGLCATHLSRLKRHGHPLAKKQKIGSEWILVIPLG